MKRMSAPSQIGFANVNLSSGFGGSGGAMLGFRVATVNT